MNNENIIQYKCFFDYNLLNKFLSDFIFYAQKNNIDSYIFKKIQIVMVEMIENNYRYIQSIEKEYYLKDFKSEFEIVRTNLGYKLISSNPIIINDTYDLKTHIDKINNSSFSQLKTLYKEILKEGMYSKKISAGTGLIRIAKVTKNKIKYSFQKIDNKLLYFTIETLVTQK